MGTVSRNTKPSGTTNWGATDTVTAALLNGDLNPIYAEFNGSIDNANIAAGAGIEASKLEVGGITNTQVNAGADIAASKVNDLGAAAHNDVDDPGSSAAQNVPATLVEELEQLRHTLAQLGPGLATGLTNGTSSGLSSDGRAAWFDGGVIGPSVIRNGSFLDGEAESTGPTAPFGWTVVDGGTGGPSTLVPVALDVARGSGQAIHMVDSSAVARDGIQQTLVGLKASSRYLVVCSIKPITSTWQLVTTGATGTFGNLAMASASGGSAWETLAGLIETDATPTNIVIRLLAGAAGAACHVSDVHVYPIGSNRAERVNAPMLVRSAVSTNDGTSIPTIETETTVGVVVPGPGYHISVSGLLVGGGNGEDLQADGEIEESVNGGAWVARSKSSISENAPGNLVAQKHISLQYDEDDPTPGDLYEYRLTATVGFQSGASLFLFDGSAGVENHRIRVTLTKV